MEVTTVECIQCDCEDDYSGLMVEARSEIEKDGWLLVWKGWLCRACVYSIVKAKFGSRELVFTSPAEGAS